MLLFVRFYCCCEGEFAALIFHMSNSRAAYWQQAQMNKKDIEIPTRAHTHAHPNNLLEEGY